MCTGGLATGSWKGAELPRTSPLRARKGSARPQTCWQRARPDDHRGDPLLEMGVPPRFLRSELTMCQP